MGPDLNKMLNPGFKSLNKYADLMVLLAYDHFYWEEVMDIIATPDCHIRLNNYYKI